MEAISKRIFDFFYTYKGFKSDRFVAKALGYSHPEKISRLFREGKPAKPSVDILEDIANKFGNELNMEWIITGRGKMLKEVEEKNESDGLFLNPNETAIVIRKSEMQKVKESLEILHSVFSMPYRADEKFGGPVEVLPLGRKQGADKEKKNRNKDK